MDEQEVQGQDSGAETEGGTRQRRPKRSKEEQLADIEAKIQAENERHERMIAKLKAAKESLRNPTKRMSKKDKVQALIGAAAKKLSPEQIAEMLGIDQDQLFS